MTTQEEKLFDDGIPPDVYDMISVWVANFGHKRRTRKMYRRDMINRVVAKIEGQPVEFAFQLGIGLVLAGLSMKFAQGGVKLFMPKSSPTVEVAVPMLSIKDLEIINNALKEATLRRS